MQVSYRWLKSLVPIQWSAAELAEKLTFAGLSVEQVIYLDQGLKNIVVGEVLSVTSHPNKDHLHICKVHDGTDVVTVVCGAPNVRPNIKVPFAKIGAVLPGNFTISAADKGGVVSYGVLCSAQELGLPDGLATAESDGGIFILPDECVVGDDIVHALWLDDAILDIELTPNRSDCHSVLNIAREVAAVSGLPLTLPEIVLPAGEGHIEEQASVDVLDTELCPRFTARLVRNLHIAPSPYWLRHHLACSGIRSINNVVDISNYVLLEMNQPSHTFDYDRLADHRIIVRRAEDGEKLVTLDETERILDHSMLLVCDGERPVSVAGVMGGLDTEIQPDTKNVLIECAYFYPKSIRLTSRALGLASDSSARFEKGIDLAQVPLASARLVQLLCQLCGGEYVGGILDTFKGEIHEQQVELRYARTRATLGVDVSNTEIAAAIEALKFPCETTADGLLVTIPAYRPDISREVDLIEEVARLWGYDKIPATLPSGQMTEGKKTKGQKTSDVVKAALVTLGFSETVTYSFMNPVHYDCLRLAADDPRRVSVKLLNPFSDEQGVMRTLMLPSELMAAALNLKRKNLNVSIFELAHVFRPVGGEKLPAEPSHLCLLTSGEQGGDWGAPARAMDFYYLKGVLAAMLSRLHITDWTLTDDCQEPFLHPGRSAKVWICGEYAGYLGELHPLVQETYGMNQRAVVMELDFSLLEKNATAAVDYQSVSRYPAVEIDLAFLAPSEISSHAIEQTIRNAGGPHLRSVELFDIYQGGQVEDGKKSLAYHLIFRDQARTLKAEEVSESTAAIRARLASDFNIVLRA